MNASDGLVPASPRRRAAIAGRVQTQALLGLLNALAGSWNYLTDPLAHTHLWFAAVNLLMAVYMIASAVRLATGRGKKATITEERS